MVIDTAASGDPEALVVELTVGTPVGPLKKQLTDVIVWVLPAGRVMVSNPLGLKVPAALPAGQPPVGR